MSTVPKKKNVAKTQTSKMEKKLTQFEKHFKAIFTDIDVIEKSFQDLILNLIVKITLFASMNVIAHQAIRGRGADFPCVDAYKVAYSLFFLFLLSFSFIVEFLKTWRMKWPIEEVINRMSLLHANVSALQLSNSLLREPLAQPPPPNTAVSTPAGGVSPATPTSPAGGVSPATPTSTAGGVSPAGSALQAPPTPPTPPRYSPLSPYPADTALDEEALDEETAAKYELYRKRVSFLLKGTKTRGMGLHILYLCNIGAVATMPVIFVVYPILVDYAYQMMHDQNSKIAPSPT